ncbi:hypothetical protein A2U01_0018593 [Trifolium medium]|uniref:Uncharacterized protein n=1 Tax=Trifolium medium TaxID=97028 RepID=A0A392NEW6_9FABA|nr:hypothetical protein [Trifolium medium]
MDSPMTPRAPIVPGGNSVTSSCTEKYHTHPCYAHLMDRIKIRFEVIGRSRFYIYCNHDAL